MPVFSGSGNLLRTPERTIAIAVIAWLTAACASPPPPAAPAPVAIDSTPAPPDTTPPPVEAPAPAPPPAPVRASLPVRLSFTGDINLGTSTLPGGIPPDDGRGLLDGVDSLLTGDFVVGNLEGVLADTGTTTKCDLPVRGRRREGQPRPQRTNCYVFLTPTRLAPRLREAGFTHLNLANNHSHDYGVAGRISSEETLKALGLRVYGPLGQISIDTVRTGDSLTILGLIGFSTYPSAPNLLDLTASAAIVDSISGLVDLVVVTFHGGAEGTGALNVARGPEYLGQEPRGDLRQWARVVIDAGADLVVGHGPHVLRGIEFYRERPVVYSLGNFLTYRGFNLAGPLGITAILQVELAGDGRFLGGRVHPLIQVPRVGPRRDAQGSAVRLIRRLSREDFGPAAVELDDDGTMRAPPPAP